MSSRKVTKNFIAMIFSLLLLSFRFLSFFLLFFLFHSLRFAFFYALASIKIIFSSLLLDCFFPFNISRVSSNKLSHQSFSFSSGSEHFFSLISPDIIQQRSSLTREGGFSYPFLSRRRGRMGKSVVKSARDLAKEKPLKAFLHFTLCNFAFKWLAHDIQTVCLHWEREMLIALILINLTRLPDNATEWFADTKRRQKERTLPADRRKLNEVPLKIQHRTADVSMFHVVVLNVVHVKAWLRHRLAYAGPPKPKGSMRRGAPNAAFIDRRCCSEMSYKIWF